MKKIIIMERQMRQLVEQTTNRNLNLAQRNKNDEFYTTYNDVEKELRHYTHFLRGKRILCPCDTQASSFVKYFEDNRDVIKYQSLDFSHVSDGTDFRNIDYSQYDVVITNPPFSLFREFINSVMRNNVYFLVIGNKNALTYKEIFNRFKNGQIWFGFNSVRSFYKPDGTMQRFGNIGWFTNIPNDRQSQPLELTKKYSAELYPKYDNYNAIDVSNVKDIPYDYYGTMGVPVTYLDKHCPEQFEIVDFRKGDDNKDVRLNRKTPYFRTFIKRKRSQDIGNS